MIEFEVADGWLSETSLPNITYVNPGRVCHIRPEPARDSITRIYFEETTVLVRGDVVAVALKLGMPIA